MSPYFCFILIVCLFDCIIVCNDALRKVGSLHINYIMFVSVLTIA